MAEERDVVIIGGGPGGYTAAIRAAQLGLQVTLIEQEALGGTCLHEGCIPSKIWTYCAGKMAELQQMGDFGVDLLDYKLQLTKLNEYKQKTIRGLQRGIESLCQQNKVELIMGKACFLDASRIGVERDYEFLVFKFKAAIIATGSMCKRDGHWKVDEQKILSEQAIFKIKELPRHLIVYGSDYISLEVASSYRSFGSEVSLVISETTLLDDAIEKELLRIFKKRDIKVYKDRKIEKVVTNDTGVEVVISDREGTKTSIEGSHFFSASDREPNIRELGIDRAGVHMSETGFIQVDQQCRTAVNHIYAIGDVTDGPTLAVKAIKQGKVAAEAIAGIASEIDLTFMPQVIHTIPPMAYVGLTEQQARQSGYEVKVSKLPITSNGYAALMGKKDGMVKVISDLETEQILGVHLIGAGAVELITSGVIALEMHSREEDLKFPTYPHPSMNESLLEAVEALVGQAIHQKPPRK